MLHSFHETPVYGATVLAAFMYSTAGVIKLEQGLKSYT